MKNISIIVLIGFILGFIDLIPLFVVKAPLFNMISIMVFWLSTTLFINKTKFSKNSALNGLMVSVLLMLPIALAVSASNPKDFIPMMFMAIALGPLAGIALKKFNL